MKHLKKIKKLSKRDKVATLKYIEDNYEDVLKEKMEVFKTNTSLTNLIANIDKEKIASLVEDKFDINSITLKDGELLNYSIINTYLLLDNHEDVHAKNLFSEYLDGLFLQSDHEFKVKSRVGDVVKAIELDVSWSDLGIEKDGDTQVLVFISIVKESYNKNIYQDYKDNRANQHSVGMWYKDLKLAVNNPLNKERYSLWKEYIDLIGNKAEAEDRGYFYVILKAGLREGSYVLLGSNSLTPSIKSYTKKDLESKNKNVTDNEDGLKKFLGLS